MSIPDGVEDIGQAAFANCTDLWAVSLPRGLKVLGSLESNSYWPGVFQATAISRIEIPPSVRLLPRHCFYGCESLREVHLTDQLTTICSGCFERSGITSLTITRGLEEIEEDAFRDCKYLTVVALQAGGRIRKIGSVALRGTPMRTLGSADATAKDAFDPDVCPERGGKLFQNSLTARI